MSILWGIDKSPIQLVPKLQRRISISANCLCEVLWLPCSQLYSQGLQQCPAHNRCSVYICHRTNWWHQWTGSPVEGMFVPFPVASGCCFSAGKSTINCNPSLSLFFGKVLQTTVTSPIKCHNSAESTNPCQEMWLLGNTARCLCCCLSVVGDFLPYILLVWVFPPLGFTLKWKAMNTTPHLQIWCLGISTGILLCDV